MSQSLRDISSSTVFQNCARRLLKESPTAANSWLSTALITHWKWKCNTSSYWTTLSTIILNANIWELLEDGNTTGSLPYQHITVYMLEIIECIYVCVYIWHSYQKKSCSLTDHVSQSMNFITVIGWVNEWMVHLAMALVTHETYGCGKKHSAEKCIWSEPWPRVLDDDDWCFTATFVHKVG